MKVAKVPPIPLYGARRSSATLALEAGVRLDVVSTRLGHASAAFTADICAHVSEAASEDAAAKVGAILGTGAAG